MICCGICGGVYLKDQNGKPRGETFIRWVVTSCTIKTQPCWDPRFLLNSTFFSLRWKRDGDSLGNVRILENEALLLVWAEGNWPLGFMGTQTFLYLPVWWGPQVFCFVPQGSVCWTTVMETSLPATAPTCTPPHPTHHATCISIVIFCWLWRSLAALARF